MLACRNPACAPGLPVLPGPYLGLLKERGSLFILDVCDLALLYLQRGSQAVILGRGHAVLHHTPPSSQGVVYLDVMALGDHNIFLGEQVLDTILGDDILHLWAGGEGGSGGKEAGAEASFSRSSAKKAEWKTRNSHQQQCSCWQAWTPGGVVWKVSFLPKVGLWLGG